MKIILLFLSVIFMPLTVNAKDLGVYGETYLIKETSFLTFITERLEELQKTGQMEQIQENMKLITFQHSNRPMPVPDITRTKKEKSWNFDPSLIMSKDITDNLGNIIVRKGDVINPLTKVSFRKTYIFYDGDDQKEINWVKSFIAKNNRKIKLILVNGSISEQTKLFNQAVYFDQNGILTQKFGIKHVPAFIYQEKLHLRVNEVTVT